MFRAMADHENMARRPLPGWRLKDCADEHLRITCPRCRGQTVMSVRGLAGRLGSDEARLWQVIVRLRCKRCRNPPKEVELLYGFEGARTMHEVRAVKLV